MPSADKKYKVCLSLCVETKDGDKVDPFHSTDLVWHGFSYAEVVALEDRLLGVLDDLNDWGVSAVAQAGQEGMLAAMGGTRKQNA